MTDAITPGDVIPLQAKKRGAKAKAALPDDLAKLATKMAYAAPLEIVRAELYKLDTLLYCLKEKLTHETPERLRRANALLDLSLELSERTADWQGEARAMQDRLIERIKTGSTEGL